MTDLKSGKLQVWQPFLLASAMAIGMLVGTRIDDQLPMVQKIPHDQAQNQWDELRNTISFIEARYGDSLDVDSISKEAIHFIVSQLDPHSYYLSGAEHQNFVEKMDGSYTGIGISYLMVRDTLQIVQVIEGGPAANAGIKIADQILRIDTIAVSGQDLGSKEAFEIWRTADKHISLEIRNPMTTQIRSLSIDKGSVKVPTVGKELMLDDRIGYLRVLRFGNDTYAEFMRGLESLAEQQMRDLIIDVRDNPGGNLDQVIKILNQLVLEHDQLLLYTKGYHTKKVEYRSTGKAFFPIERLIVLVDENSVSASEVLAGCLQDLGRAVIVGRRTFGKALVQEMYDLSSSSSLNLTVSKYYLPSGRYIQRSYSDREAYDKDLKTRVLSGEFYWAERIEIDSTNMKRGLDGKLRPVGEGVVPDVFVAADTLDHRTDWHQWHQPIYKDAIQIFVQSGRQPPSWLTSRGQDFEKLVKDRALFSDIMRQDPSFSNSILDQYYRDLYILYFGEEKYLERMVKKEPEVEGAVKYLKELNQ